MDSKDGEKTAPKRTRVWWKGPGDMIVDGKTLNRKTSSLVPDDLIARYAESFSEVDPNAEMETKDTKEDSATTEKEVRATVTTPESIG